MYRLCRDLDVEEENEEARVVVVNKLGQGPIKDGCWPSTKPPPRPKHLTPHEPTKVEDTEC